MKFSKEMWDKAHLDSIRETYPDKTEEELQAILEAESSTEDWKAFERMFQEKLATYSVADLVEIMNNSAGVMDFNEKFFGMKFKG